MGTALLSVMAMQENIVSGNVAMNAFHSLISAIKLAMKISRSVVLILDTVFQTFHMN